MLAKKREHLLPAVQRLLDAVHWPVVIEEAAPGALVVVKFVVFAVRLELGFVLVDLLSSNSGNTPMSVYIYSQQRGGNGGPALNALGTIMLVMSFVIAIIGYIGYRFLTRGERGGRVDAFTAIAGGEG